MKFYEFFAGGGMSRAGLGPNWDCVIANDFDEEKAAVYRDNWGAGELRVGDIAALKAKDFPGRADLAWGSFPCQDLSLAGDRAGLKGKRSGLYWEFSRILHELHEESRVPKIVAIENVSGLITSHAGSDIEQIFMDLVDLGYRVGALVLDAIHFVPQSRPRLFIVGAREVASPLLLQDAFSSELHPPKLREVISRIQESVNKSSVGYWQHSLPPERIGSLDVLIDDAGFDEAVGRRLWNLMTPMHQSRAANLGHPWFPQYGTVFLRTRPSNGSRVQRAEIRIDQVAGCLRTPGGGSSRQYVVTNQGDRFVGRLMNPRETARLMGLPETYVLPARLNPALHLTGDGVVVPVVSFLRDHVLEPLALSSTSAVIGRP